MQMPDQLLVLKVLACQSHCASTGAGKDSWVFGLHNHQDTGLGRRIENEH